MNRYLAVWDMLGLEYLVNLTAIEKKKLFSILSEEELPAYPNLNAIMMRAQFNSQRHYEIYIFDSEIDEEELKECFEHSPQTIVNCIREVGQRVYGEGRGKERPVIV